MSIPSYVKRALRPHPDPEIVAERTTAYPFPSVVALVLAVRFTVGSRSRCARSWLIRGPVVLAGLGGTC